MDERKLRQILESLVRSSQGNFDHLSGEAREFARLFNLLAEDVDFLYDALGIEKDDAHDEFEPGSTINLEVPEHVHPAVELELPQYPIIFGGDGGDDGNPGAPGRDGVAGADGADGDPAGSFVPSEAFYRSYRVEAPQLSGGMYRWNSGAFTAVTDILVDSEYYFFDLQSSASGFDASFSYDPLGFTNPASFDDPTDFWGAGSFPAGTTVVLPKGLYVWHVGVTFEDPVPPSEEILPVLSWAFDQTDPAYSGPAQQAYPLDFTTPQGLPEDLGVDPTAGRGAGIVLIDTDDTVLAPGLLTQGAGSATGSGVAGFAFTLYRLAPGEGDKGNPGVPGFQGDEGDPGMFIPGPAGVGTTGADGAPGATVPGFAGDDGDTGMFVPGTAGTAGADGATGAAGQSIPGMQGEEGESFFIPGPPGESSSGPQGPAGPPWPGEDGSDGSFLPGTSGTNGVDGAVGAAGQSIPGRQGDDGDDGMTIVGRAGTDGAAGANGSPGPPWPGDDGDNGMTIVGATGATGAAGGGGSGATGTTTVNFGAFPGATDTSVDVTGQATIAAGSVVDAWIRPEATGDHSADEHMVEPVRIYAGNIVAGTGFTIYAFIDDQQPVKTPTLGDFESLDTNAANSAAGRDRLGGGSVRDQGTGVDEYHKGRRLYGQYTVAWRWS
jgi:hypothetical protein